MSHSQRPRYPYKVGNYWLGERLGAGYSGAIFKATNLNNEEIVAVKIQDVNHECPTNRYERAFYPLLQGGKGMPKLYASGVEGQWDYLAIDLLGPSLDSLLRKSGKKFMDLRSVLCIAMQVIARLETMHNRGILHRDIQLGNCTVGLEGDATLIYMIDFGFSKIYIDQRTGRHIPDSKARRDFIGNYWFSSVGVHCKNKVPSRRDDLEALALMLIHLLTPDGLSWTRNGVPKDDAAHTRLKRAKQAATPEELCKGLPEEFEEFLKYCRRLKFAECPDYEYWIEEFRCLAEAKGYPPDDAFIWPPPNPEPAVRVATHGRPSLEGDKAEMEGILNDLAHLQLGQRQILGERNVNDIRRNIAAPGKKPPGRPRKASDEVIVVSDDDENVPKAHRLPKALHLTRLTKAVDSAADNSTLSQLVSEFVEVIKENRSRTLTKEGFAFLDALYKQLADPSVFIVPMRTSKSRTQINSTQSKADDVVVDARRMKMNKLFALRREVHDVMSNKALAGLVADFGAVIDKSNGRTVTKDAIGFLEGLATRLKVVQ
ncbi:CK1/CK1 protein kinase [Abortiporus biennis]|nr:CK1/CK1 protein kinase [Abortiporus biennis]